MLLTIDTYFLLPFRKKLSNFSHSSNWKSAYNYVAKRYMETVDRNVYFEDVRLQMEAKLWGEEYNRHRPPKQVRERTAVTKSVITLRKHSENNLVLTFWAATDILFLKKIFLD